MVRRNVLLDGPMPIAGPIPIPQATSSTPQGRGRPLAALDLPRPPGVIGAVSKSLEALTSRSQRVGILERELATTEAVREIDPALIDPSFAQDRMVPFAPEGADADFVAAIKDQGQLVPVLVRVRSDDKNRYQPAYGRRRIAAALFLGLKVRAVVRDLSDEELVVAQGQENESRNALSFIEKCRFAATLETQGFKRKIIENALNVAQPNLSTMLQIVENIPAAVIDWIGPAPELGRPRWLELAGFGKNEKLRSKMAALVGRENISADITQSSARRLAYILSAMAERKSTKGASTAWVVLGQKKAYGSLAVSSGKITLTVDRKAHPALAAAMLERIDQIRHVIEADVVPSINKEN